MKKKLMSLIFIVLVLLIGKTEAASYKLTQKMGNGFISATLNAGQQVTIRFINQGNYTFSGWTVESGGITLAQTAVATFTMPSSDVVIKANYTVANSSVTVTYNANGGTGTMNSQSVSAGGSLTLTTNTFTRSGYIFKGWSTSSSATTATYTDGQTITPSSSMTLYAVWQQNYKCKCSDCSNYITSGTYCTTCSGYSKCKTCGDCSYHYERCSIHKACYGYESCGCTCGNDEPDPEPVGCSCELCISFGSEDNCSASEYCTNCGTGDCCASICSDCGYCGACGCKCSSEYAGRTISAPTCYASGDDCEGSLICVSPAYDIWRCTAHDIASN